MLTALEEESMASMAGGRHGLGWSSSWRLESTRSRLGKLMVVLKLIGCWDSESPGPVHAPAAQRGSYSSIIQGEKSYTLCG